MDDGTEQTFEQSALKTRTSAPGPPARQGASVNSLQDIKDFQAHLLARVEQAIIATNLDGIVIYWNQFAEKLYGWTSAEATGRHVMELTTPEQMTEQALDIMSRLRQGESWTGEFNVQRRDGTTFPVQIINSPINDDHGTLIGIVGVSIDISERKQQEDSLIELTRQLERQSNVFNTTLSAITDFAYIFDREGRFIYANQPLLDLWGLKLDEAVGKNFYDLQYPNDLALRLQQQIQQVFDTGQPLRDETPYTSPTGAEGFYEYIFTPVFAADGTVEVVAGSTRDYTERRRVETALRENRERLQMAMNAAKIYSWELNLATQQVEWSNNLERVIGFHLPSDFAIVNEFIHPEDRKETVMLISQAIGGGTDFESQFRLVNPQSGEIVWVRGQGVLVGDAQNSPQRFVGITQNITERKHSEILLDTQKQALEMVVGGSPLAEVLKYLTGIVEHQSAGSSIASIMLLHEGRLYNGASPSLPETYVQAVEGIEADKSVGTCSAAAATSKTIITPDIAADPKWQDFKHLPLELGLQAAWSFPIVAADKRVLGTFGTYFREKREPTMLERQTVEILARTAALAIERKRAEEELNSSEERLRTIFEASRDGILVEDDERIIYVNHSYTQMLGYDAPEELIGNHVSSVISAEDSERLLEFGKSRARGKLPSSVYEFKGKRKDGTLIELEASVSASAVTGHRYITSIVRDITERKRAEAELKQINEQLEGRVTERTAALSEMNAMLQEEVRDRRRIEAERVELLRRIVCTQEDERRRIAREMHDQFGQQLTVLKLKLDAIKEDCGENQKLFEQVDALQTLAMQLDEDVDHMVWDLRPTALDDLGLHVALSSYVANWEQHLGIPVQLHTSGMDGERLTPQIETALYRIAQEALNNIAKHAQAAQVAIVLERRADQVSLIVEDDGAGFDLQQVFGAEDKGLGLIGMRERAALVDGTIEIESRPNKGATVVVRITVPSIRNGEAR